MRRIAIIIILNILLFGCNTPFFSYGSVIYKYQNGYIKDYKGVILFTYRNGFVIDKDNNTVYTYRNGYILDQKDKIVYTYKNGYVRNWSNTSQ